MNSDSLFHRVSKQKEAKTGKFQRGRLANSLPLFINVFRQNTVPAITQNVILKA